MDKVVSWEDYLKALIGSGSIWQEREHRQFMDEWSYIEKVLKDLPEEYKYISREENGEEYDDEYADALPISLDEYLLPTTTTLD